MDFIDTGFLEDDEIKLVLEKFKEADPERKRVPAYCFLICDKQGNKIGSCDLKTGYTKELYYSKSRLMRQLTNKTAKHY